MGPVRIATRPSKLALVQTDIVANALRQLSPRLSVSVVPVSTKGDRDRSDFLYKAQGQGLFTSEVENALLEHRADIAVHSLKDLPTAPKPGLIVAAILEREAVADALVASAPVRSIADLPSGATVGTSSPRRIAQLRAARGDLRCVPLRGNVETRVSKVASGAVDAAVIALAGLRRLGLDDKASAVLPPDRFLPAPAQGALAAQIRADDTALLGLVSQLDHEQSRITAEAERLVLASMHGGCSIPLGVHARCSEGSITIDALISDMQGTLQIRRSRTAPIDKAETCARKLAQEMLDAGGKQILDQIRPATDGG